jgi:hypothetical protein
MTDMKIHPSIVVAGLALGSLHAAVFTDRASWEAAILAPQDVALASQFGEFDVLPAGDALALPSGNSLTFNYDVQALQVPGSWATWSGGKTPMVLYSLYEPQIEGTFASPAEAFGFEIQPNNLVTVDITLELANGESLTQSVQGDSGALFFGWLDSAGVQSFNLSAADGNDFAFGEMTLAIPEPQTFGVAAGLGLAALAISRRLRA